MTTIPYINPSLILLCSVYHLTLGHPLSVCINVPKFPASLILYLYSSVYYTPNVHPRHPPTPPSILEASNFGTGRTRGYNLQLVSKLTIYVLYTVYCILYRSGNLFLATFTHSSAAILWAAEMNYDLARSLHLRNSVDGSIF